jgi:acetylornithine deacetylase/succinyl-diaminopimelate desuccinylase family protein
MSRVPLRGMTAVPVDPQEVVDLAADLIRIPTVNGAGEAGAIAAIGSILRREGIDHRIEEVAAGRPNLIVEMGDGRGPTLWFNGHIDTVPIGNRLSWSREPFGGDIHDGRLYGRGASDCKGGVAAIIQAVIALHRARVPLAGRLRVTAVMGDEEGWIGIRHLLDCGMRADAFVSTQWSTAGRIALGYRGLCWVEITTMGRMAHGSRPSTGVNAVQGMVDDVLPALRTLELPSAEATPVAIPGPSVNLAVMQGGEAPNIVPDLCRAVLDYRLVSGQSSAQVIDAIDAVLSRVTAQRPGLRVERRVLLRSEPLFTNPEVALVRSLSESVEAIGGHPASYFGKTGTADANLVHERLQIPAVAYGPGNDSVHGPDEWVDVNELAQVARVYADFAARFLAPSA